MPDGQRDFDQLSRDQGYSTPRPDPTLLTTEQLMREITRLESLMALQIAAVDERLQAEIKLTTARLKTADIDREAIRGLIQNQVDYAAADRLAIKEEIDGRFESAELVHQGIRDVTNEKFAAIAQQHEALREMLNERYQTQTKALDAAFVAQQAAVATSFDASEKAMAAALLAAKEAVEKANTATEKRFDGVNELLGQQTATVAALLPRAEAEARITALDARLTDLKSTVDKGFTGVDVRQLAGGEQRDVRADARGGTAIMIAGASVLLTLVLSIVTAIHLLH